MADSGSSSATATSPSLTEGVGVWAGVAVGVGVVRFTIAEERDIWSGQRLETYQVPEGTAKSHDYSWCRLRLAL